jgi:hypothetical protein
MFVDLCIADDSLKDRAAVVLFEAFRARRVPAWPTLGGARTEVAGCSRPS